MSSLTKKVVYYKQGTYFYYKEVFDDFGTVYKSIGENYAIDGCSIFNLCTLGGATRIKVPYQDLKIFWLQIEDKFKFYKEEFVVKEIFYNMQEVLALKTVCGRNFLLTHQIDKFELL